jgi:hypothetical protein
MQNKIYFGVMLSFCSSQIVWGSEQKSPGFGGMPGILDANARDEVIIEIPPVYGEIEKEIKAVLAGAGSSRGSYRFRSPGRGEPDGSHKLAEAVLRLAHVADQANERQVRAERLQAEAELRQAKSAKCNRYVTYASSAVSNIVSAVSLGFTIYNIVRQ